MLRKIVELVREAQLLANQLGITNILQPGLVKEIIIADILGHRINTNKRDHDATDPSDPSKLYEYLTCYEGGSFQIDRVFKEPQNKRDQSLSRISRNHRIFLAIFTKGTLTVSEIIELLPSVALREAERQIDASVNVISHVGFSISWAREHGTVVYPTSHIDGPTNP